MKPVLTALAVALAAASPALAQNVDMSTLTPALTFPTTDTVTQSAAGLNSPALTSISN